MFSLNKKTTFVIALFFGTIFVQACSSPSENEFQKPIVAYFKSNIVPEEDQKLIVYNQYEQIDKEKITFIDGSIGYLVSSLFEVTSSKDGKFYAAVVTTVREKGENLLATGAVFSWISEEKFNSKYLQEKLKDRQEKSKLFLVVNGELLAPE